MLKINMDAIGLLQTLASSGVTFDFTRVYSGSSSNNSQSNTNVIAGVYLILFNGIHRSTSNDPGGGLCGTLIVSSSDSTKIYCSSSYLWIQFTSSTIIRTYAAGTYSSLAISLIGIKTE